MFGNQKLCEGVALAAALAPVTLANTELFTGVVDLGANQQAMGILMLGNMAAETIDFKFYSCDSDGSNAAAVTGKAATQLAAHASSNDGKMVVINVRDTDLLASGKQYGKFGAVTGGATGGPAAMLVVASPRQGQADANDSANVVQIVG